MWPVIQVHQQVNEDNIIYYQTRYGYLQALRKEYHTTDQALERGESLEKAAHELEESIHILQAKWDSFLPFRQMVYIARYRGYIHIKQGVHRMARMARMLYSEVPRVLFKIEYRMINESTVSQYEPIIAPKLAYKHWIWKANFNVKNTSGGDKSLDFSWRRAFRWIVYNPTEAKMSGYHECEV
jgi:hypothetical protein